MRDVIFKNLTSQDKRRRIITSSEIIDDQHVRSIIHKHFICMIKETDSMETSTPQVYLTKEHNSKQQRERVFCKIKGKVHVIDKGINYWIIFMHSLKIDLMLI